MTPTELKQTIAHPQCLKALKVFALALAAVVLLSLMFWRPARQAAGDAEEALATTREDLRAYQQASKLAGEYAIRIQQADAMETKLNQSKGEPEFIREVETLATRSGAELTQFSSHKSQVQGAVRSTMFEFFMSGSYANLKQFVVSFKEMNEFVSVERAVFEHGEQTVKAHLIIERRQRAE
jgi:Tfp pilus assembly protein PilO